MAAIAVDTKSSSASSVCSAVPHQLSWSKDDFTYHLALVPPYDPTQRRRTTTDNDDDNKTAPTNNRLQCDRPDAALRVAFYYLYGMNGTHIDPLRGLHYCEVAATAGSIGGVNSSCSLLGTCYAKGYGMSRPLMDIACALWRMDLAPRKSDDNLSHGGRYIDGWTDELNTLDHRNDNDADDRKKTLPSAAILIPRSNQQWHAQMMAGTARAHGTSFMKADLDKAAPIFEQGNSL
jgi:TPR repeat protein